MEPGRVRSLDGYGAWTGTETRSLDGYGDTEPGRVRACAPRLGTGMCTTAGYGHVHPGYTTLATPPWVHPPMPEVTTPAVPVSRTPRFPCPS